MSRRQLGPVLAALAVLTATGAVASPPNLDPETERLVVEAVETAAALDFYNARCRSDVSGRHTDSLNRELVEKIRTTVISVQDYFFPEKSFRRVQTRLQEKLQDELRQAGGCKGAKESGLPERLRAQMQEQMDAIEALP
jgi:hypothetical protein